MSRKRVARAAGTALAVAAVTAATACATTHAATTAPPPAPAVTPTVPPTVAVPEPQPSTPATARPAPPPTAAGTYAEYLRSDGNLLYVMAPGAHAWKLLGPVPTPVVDDDNQTLYSASRDMRRVLVTDNADRSLWNQAVDGSDRRLVIQPPKGYVVCNAQFDAPGDRILYGMTRDGKNLALYTVHTDGTGRHRVPGATTYDACDNAWSPDGSTILFMNTYVDGLPIREYHEVNVYDGTRTRKITLQITNKVHVGTPDAVSSDGRYALIGAKTVNAQGECGDGDDRWFIADLRTGATTELFAPKGGYVETMAARFDRSDRLLAIVETNIKIDGQDVLKREIGVFDRHARLVATLPNPSGDQTETFTIWTVVA
jgi:hypothetical protein